MRIFLISAAALVVAACGQNPDAINRSSVTVSLPKATPSSLSPAQQKHVALRDETNDADDAGYHAQDPTPPSAPSPYIRCASHESIARDMLADGMSLDSYEGGGTGTESIVEVYNDGARKQLRVVHGPDKDCIVNPDAE